MRKNTRKWLIRAVALVMALLLIGSAVVVALQSFAAPNGLDMRVIPLGSEEGDDPSWPIYVAAGAGLLVLICLVLPKLKKKE